jgi:hypothetical protein
VFLMYCFVSCAVSFTVLLALASGLDGEDSAAEDSARGEGDEKKDS